MVSPSATKRCSPDCRFRKPAHSGMDFQRVALTTCRTADDALEQLIELTETLHPGRPHGAPASLVSLPQLVLNRRRHDCVGIRNRGSVLGCEARARRGHHLERADDPGRLRSSARRRLQARSRSWLGEISGRFQFASAFSDRAMSLLAGASIRRACTGRSLSGVREPAARDLIVALADHGSREPGTGLRSEAPCAHASWLPTRTSAQTTSSIVARLDASGPTVWATGTSSPCLSVFKPAPFDSELLPPRPVADSRFDARELWWAHERLHRACLADYHPRRVTFAEDRERFQDDCLRPGADPKRSWRDHRARIDDWLGRALQVKASRRPPLTRWFWSSQSRAMSIPG